MDKYIFAGLIGLLFSSCATIFNHSVQKISVTTDKRIRLVSVDSSIQNPGGPNYLYIKRSENPITLNLVVDSMQQKLNINPFNSFAYWSNIYFNYGIGMLIDKNNPKRYSYPKRMNLRLKDNKVVVGGFAPTLKGTITWNIALPHVNSFYLTTPGGHRNSTGFWGIESGLDYFYKDNHFISVYGGAATDFFVPAPAPVTIYGEYQTSSGVFASVRNNYRVGSFDVGYGVAYSTLYWRKTNNTDSTFNTQTKTNSALGLSFSTSFRCGKFFQLGLLYQPYLFRIDSHFKGDYQHQISIELIWKIPIRRGLPKA